MPQHWHFQLLFLLTRGKLFLPSGEVMEHFSQRREKGAAPTLPADPLLGSSVLQRQTSVWVEQFEDYRSLSG